MAAEMSKDLYFTIGAVLALSLILGLYMARTEMRLEDLETQVYNLEHPPAKLKKEQA